MFTRHHRPTPSVLEARRERHHRKQALLRVRLREEFVALIDAFRSDRVEDRFDTPRSLYL